MFHSVNNLFIWLYLICWLSDFKICDAWFIVLLWQALLIDWDMHGHSIAKGLEGMSMAVRISWRQSTRFSKKLMINAVYHDNPLIFIGATFREKLVSHHRTMNEGCFWHCIKYNKFRLPCHAFDFYRGYVSGEAYLPSSGSEWRLFMTLYLPW